MCTYVSRFWWSLTTRNESSLYKIRRIFRLFSAPSPTPSPSSSSSRCHFIHVPRCQTVFHRRDQTEHAQIDRKDTATAREVGTNSHGKTLTSPRTLLNTSQNKTNRGIHACRTCAYACIYTRNRTLVSGDDFEYHSPRGRLRENNIYNGENLSGFEKVVEKKSWSTDFVIPCVPCTTHFTFVSPILAVQSSYRSLDLL